MEAEQTEELWQKWRRGWKPVEKTTRDRAAEQTSEPVVGAGCPFHFASLGIRFTPARGRFAPEFPSFVPNEKPTPRNPRTMPYRK